MKPSNVILIWFSVCLLYLTAFLKRCNNIQIMFVKKLTTLAVFWIKNSERPEWNFTETGPKPKYEFFTVPEPNRNRNSIPKQYYKYFLNFQSLQCIFNKHWKYFLCSIMKSLSIVSFCGV